MKNIIKLENYYSPDELRYRLAEFVEYYNHHRYHETIDNLTRTDVYFGRKEKRLQERERIKRTTLKRRKIYYYFFYPKMSNLILRTFIPLSFDDLHRRAVSNILKPAFQRPHCKFLAT
jgi:hypothetical protein